MKRALLALLSLCFLPSLRAQVSLYTAVDLALRNSPAVQVATTDVQRTAAALLEARDVYKPNLVVGSGLGYTYGFPVGQPSIVNFTSQSLVLSYSQPDYIRSARAGARAAELALKDTRQQVILDTALSYIELDKIAREMGALDEQDTAAGRLAEIEKQRLDAGLEGRTELLRAQLTAAQVRLKHLHAEDSAALLREKLAHLTGLSPGGFTTATSTIPETASPAGFGVADDMLAMENQGVQAAYASAKAHTYIALGDHRLNRPQIGFGAQYALFSSTINNYNSYYTHKFQANNFVVGISITFPLFDISHRDKGRESAADAAHAVAQADQLRDTTAEQTLQLQKSLRELASQEEVAQLQSQISQSELETVRAELQSGAGSAGGPQLTPKDEQQARIQERQRYIELLDTSFELTRARLSLLRATGSIEDWAKLSTQR